MCLIAHGDDRVLPRQLRRQQLRCGIAQIKSVPSRHFDSHGVHLFRRSSSCAQCWSPCLCTPDCRGQLRAGRVLCAYEHDVPCEIDWSKKLTGRIFEGDESLSSIGGAGKAPHYVRPFEDVQMMGEQVRRESSDFHEFAGSAVRNSQALSDEQPPGVPECSEDTGSGGNRGFRVLRHKGKLSQESLRYLLLVVAFVLFAEELLEFMGDVVA